MALVALIERPGFTIAADRAVIKRDEFHLVAQAGGILEATSQEAARVLEQAGTAARKDGYRDGYEAGRLDAASTLAAEAFSRLKTVERLETTLIQIVVESVSAVLQRIGRDRLLFESLSAVRDTIRRARWATLRVPPESLEAARRALDMLAQETGRRLPVEAMADDALSGDDCLLETDSGVIDAGLATLAQGVHAAITSAMAGTVDLVPQSADAGGQS